MPQAIADPEELKRFANLLKKFNTELVDRSNALAGQLESLSTTWRDQENKKFAEQFSQQLKGVTRLVEVNNEYIPFLMRKAARIEEYLQQR
ncbi:MAG: hypothetical protein CMJ65_17555 [Planctomycetaceae bacterium]|jgi:uncharacterized protein YukE|nr:hypothetical protein [Planctomycetaceae bacterium]MDP7274633.1 WXG100 family type VII secretion target [Planctomycetaceae bacterium]